MLNDNQKAKLKKAILEGKVSDKTTLQVFQLVSDLEEKVESLTKELKETVDKSIAEVKASEVSLDKVLESVKGKDAIPPTDEHILEIIKPFIPPPIKGEPGDDYVLTQDDKLEIAKKIKVPVVEKIIEKTETIVEQPLVTNEIKEVAKYETGKQIADKLNILEEVVDQKVIKGLTKKITDLSSNIAHNAAKLYTGISETRALELIDQNTTTAVRTKRVVTATDATSITPNADTSDWTEQVNTQATGTLTINAPTGTPSNKQAWGLEIKSTNVQTFSWNAVFVGGTTALPTATTGGGKIDLYTFVYSTTNSKWIFSGLQTNVT